MNLPDGERQLITIDREVTVDCPIIQCKAGTLYQQLSSNEGPVAIAKCDHCNGTGRVKRRIVGWCEVEVELFDNTTGYTPDDRIDFSTVPYHRWHDEGSIYKPIEYADHMRDKVVTAYLDGTLPPELAENIKEDTNGKN